MEDILSEEEQPNKLYPKYMVGKAVNGTIDACSLIEATNPDNIDSPFVLFPRKDPAAITALKAYASVCNPALAAEIREWLTKVVEAKPEFGTQGTRNYQAMMSSFVSEVQ